MDKFFFGALVAGLLIAVLLNVFPLNSAPVECIEQGLVDNTIRIDTTFNSNGEIVGLKFVKK